MDALLTKHGVVLTGSVRCTEIHQQNLGIDELARICDEDTTHILLIDDKTYSDEHSSQIKRYYKEVLNGASKLGTVYDKSSVRSIFLKTGNQSRHKNRRKEFLCVLKSYLGDHPIVTDFGEYLNRFQTAIKGYRG